MSRPRPRWSFSSLTKTTTGRRRRGTDDGGADDGAGAVVNSPPPPPAAATAKEGGASRSEGEHREGHCSGAGGRSGGTLSNVVGGPVGLVELGLRGDAWAPSDPNEAKAKRNFY